jgi:hypothetical protein
MNPPKRNLTLEYGHTYRLICLFNSASLPLRLYAYKVGYAQMQANQFCLTLCISVRDLTVDVNETLLALGSGPILEESALTRS